MGLSLCCVWLSLSLFAGWHVYGHFGGLGLGQSLGSWYYFLQFRMPISVRHTPLLKTWIFRWNSRMGPFSEPLFSASDPSLYTLNLKKPCRNYGRSQKVGKSSGPSGPKVRYTKNPSTDPPKPLNPKLLNPKLLNPKPKP